MSNKPGKSSSSDKKKSSDKLNSNEKTKKTRAIKIRCASTQSSPITSEEVRFLMKSDDEVDKDNDNDYPDQSQDRKRKVGATKIIRKSGQHLHLNDFNFKY